MELALICAQVFILVAMVDVWLLRYDQPLLARGGDARTMAEEFRLYGLPDWFRHLIRALKLGCGALVFLGIWFPLAAVVAGSLLAALMAGAIAMHVKIKDPWVKSVPATFFFTLSVFVAYMNWTAAAAA